MITMAKTDLMVLPDSVADKAAGPLTANFGGMLMSYVDKANKIITELDGIQTAKSTAKARIETSDDPKAIEYVALKAEQEQLNKEVKAKFQEQLDVIYAQIKAETKDIDDAVKAAEQEAMLSVIGQIVSDADPETLAKELAETVTLITNVKNMLLPEQPELKGWRAVGVGAVKGTKGEGTWKPRLSFASVNGVEVKDPTGKSIAAAAGINDFHNFLNWMEKSLGGNREALPTDHPFEFEQDVNGQTVKFAVQGREKPGPRKPAAPVAEKVAE